MDVPAAGVIRRAAVDCDVIVGTFEEVAQVNGSKDKVVQPDLSQCHMPLRMKITPADPQVKTSEEVLTLQDSSGKHAFKGSHGMLETNYVVLVEDAAAGADGRPVYSLLPVSHWVNFQRAPNLPQLTVEEQEELYEMQQKYGERPSRAKRVMDRYNEKVRGAGKFTDEGGIAQYTADLEDTETGFGGTYRTAMAAASRKRTGGSAGGGGGAADDGPVFDGENFETAYDTIAGAGAAAAGGEDEFGDGGDPEARVRARDGADYADEAAAGNQAKEYDVIGDEGGLEEAAADLMVDYFADDAGDDGALADDDGVRMDGRDYDAEDVEAGGAAAARAEEDLGVDLDSDALDGDDLAKAAAAAAASASAKPEEEEPDKAGKRGSSDLESRAAKRGRFDADNIESMREELVSFLRSQGGKCTAAALSKAFGSHVKDAEKKQRFFALVGETTKQTKEIDGKLYFVLKK